MVLLSATPKSPLPPTPLAAAARLLPTFPLGFSLGPFRPRLPPCACFLAMEAPVEFGNAYRSNL